MPPKPQTWAPPPPPEIPEWEELYRYWKWQLKKVCPSALYEIQFKNVPASSFHTWRDWEYEKTDWQPIGAYIEWKNKNPEHAWYVLNKGTLQTAQFLSDYSNDLANQHLVLICAGLGARSYNCIELGTNGYLVDGLSKLIIEQFTTIPRWHHAMREHLPYNIRDFSGFLSDQLPKQEEWKSLVRVLAFEAGMSLNTHQLLTLV